MATGILGSSGARLGNIRLGAGADTPGVLAEAASSLTLTPTAAVASIGHWVGGDAATSLLVAADADAFVDEQSFSLNDAQSTLTFTPLAELAASAQATLLFAPADVRNQLATSTFTVALEPSVPTTSAGSNSSSISSFTSVVSVNGAPL